MQQNVFVAQTQPTKRYKKTRKNPMSRTNRLFRVQIGVAAGKSNRLIAKQLGVDEGTVRRDRLTLLLAKEEVQAVKSGAPVEPLLRNHERRKAATAREKLEMAERQSMFLTNRLATLIDDWLKQFEIGAVNNLHVISGINFLSWQYQGTVAEFIPDSRIKATIEATKPKHLLPQEHFLRIEYAKIWLFRWIVVMEPDRDIRDRALIKVRQALERQTPYC
jgi:hypothetical protein